MTTPDFSPRPDEVAGILRRAQRRRLRKAGEVLAGAGLCVLLLAAMAGTGGSGDRASVDVVDGPSRTPSPAPSAEETPPTGEGSGGASPGTTASGAPGGQPGSTTDPAPGSSGEGEPSRGGTARPGPGEEGGEAPARYPAERSTAAGRATTEQGCQSRVVNPTAPTQAAAGNTWCLIIEAYTPTGSSSATTVYPYGGGGVSSSRGTGPGIYEFRFSVCRHADAVSDLRLSFAQAPEVEFVVRRSSFDGPVVWTYSSAQSGGGAAHSAAVRRGDCLQWQIDWDPYDDAGARMADGGYVMEGRSLAREVAERPGVAQTFRVGESE